jgi:hypothetical protein
MLGQKRVHAARRDQMPNQRRGIQQLPIRTGTTLHPPIIDQTRSQPAQRHTDYSAVSYLYTKPFDRAAEQLGPDQAAVRLARKHRPGRCALPLRSRRTATGRC